MSALSRSARTVPHRAPEKDETRAGASLPARRWILVQVGLRASWVVALLLLVWGGEHVLDVTQPIDETRLTVPFAIGVTLCAMVLMAARAGRLRWSALLLGVAHGAGWVLTWSALS